MRHSSWEEDSDEDLSLNDCRVKNYEEFGDAGNGTFGQRPRTKWTKKYRKTTIDLIKILKSMSRKQKDPSF